MFGLNTACTCSVFIYTLNSARKEIAEYYYWGVNSVTETQKVEYIATTIRPLLVENVHHNILIIYILHKHSKIML